MIAAIMNKMILSSNGSFHDINHLIKVWTYAKTIGELEGIDPEVQTILEITAIVHDIACPSLRARYGHSNGKLQELEGPAMAKELLSEFGLTDAQMRRVMDLVGHHHTYEGVDGMDYQILLEADYLVNANEGNHSIEQIREMNERFFRTASGKALLASLYHL